MIFTTDQQQDFLKLSPNGQSLIKLREKFIERWLAKVREDISAAQHLEEPLLVDTLPAFIDNVAQAISPDYPRELGSESSTLAEEHGGERARMTNYSIASLIREYQHLRWTILEVAEEEGVHFSAKEVRIISASLDLAIQQSVTAFALIQSDLREQVVATLTHDIRTPLNYSSVAASLILKDPSSHVVPDLAQKIINNNSRIDKMVQNLLDNTIIKSGGRVPLEIVECDMRDLLLDLLKDFTQAHGERFRLEGQTLRGHWGESALKRAFENLLNNAVKYGAKESPITIRFAATHGRAVVNVHNQGNPISVSEKEAIFQIFRRAKETKDDGPRGWGIGLALVRSVAESHGGSVIVDSSHERGTTFTIDIPIDSRPHHENPVS